MKKVISKIFFGFFVGFFMLAVVLLGVHTYYSDYHFSAIHEFHNPVSEFLDNDKKDINVLLVSDTGSHNILLGEIIKHAFATKNYDFVMYLGDMTKNASVTGYYWMLDSIKPVLNGVPFYTVPGNHDITRRIGLTKKHFIDKSLYENVMGPRYYWFGYGNTLFITLDSSDTTLDSGQLVWLDKTLAKIRPMFRNCVILGHVPPANSRPDFFEDHITDAESTESFKRIIKKYKINAMFFGHVHYYSRGSFAGIDFWTLPSSGQAIRNPKNPNYGYVSLNIDTNGRVGVEPGYIEFNGDKRNGLSEWIVRDVLSVKVRFIISVALLLSLISFVGFLISKPKRK